MPMQNLDYRKTKIVATIGPASSSPEMLVKLIKAGLNVARLNFSHGAPEEHRTMVERVRAAGAEAGSDVGILQDLSGPKIRLGNIRDRELETGSTVRLAPGSEEEDDALPVNYQYLLEDVSIGETVLLFDGKLSLKVTAKDDKALICEVAAGGRLSSHKGVNLPHSNLRIPAFTEKDRSDLTVGLEAGVDFVAMSFVRSAKDLIPVREMMARSSRPPLLIAKIEKPQAVAAIDEILEVVDGIMVARGDLGVEMPIEEVPVTQKKLIHAARRRGRLVITATQMLGSMVSSPMPSRAEVTDVANAILDGTDAVMLSEETAVGQYPVKAVRMLDKVARHTEPILDNRSFLHEDQCALINPVAGAITRAVALLAGDLKSKAIVAASQGGNTARLVAHLRQPVPVVGLTSNAAAYRQLTLSWGVIPALIQPCDSIVLLEQLASEWLVRNGIAEKGDKVFLTCGMPLQTSGTTNLIKLIDIGESTGR
ncbi:MAG: pyruvate kinase [Candidatus Adiutrix sp.]|jgi:pyruvate kinase|nr:pyruvate kinase [Candidatus Adiutrix sp.]